MEGSTVKKRESGRGATWKSYIPLFVVIALALLAAGAKQIHYEAGDYSVFMRDFMGFFLVEFSMLKFFNLEGFADGFQMYDLLAKRSRIYAYFYPFIELGLGLAFLTSWRPDVVFGATIVVMVFGALGVASALRQGLDTECACMGSILNVPLSTVALTEDLGMAGMAVVMLAM
jgi:hypothetical protein